MNNNNNASGGEEGSGAAPRSGPNRAVSLKEAHPGEYDEYEDLLGSGGVLVLKTPSVGGVGQSGEKADFKQAVLVHARGRVRGGETFVDTTANTAKSKGAPFWVHVGETVLEPVPPGAMLALRMAGPGETVRVVMDHRYGYGDEGHVGLGVPPMATLEYEFSVIQLGDMLKEPGEMDMVSPQDELLRKLPRCLN